MTRLWTLATMTLALSVVACGLSPESAREELGRLGVDYTAQAFVQAVANNDVRAVELFLVSGMDPDSEVSGWTSVLSPLKQAVADANAGIVDMLLAAGANPQLGLDEAIERNDVAMTSTLLDAGAVPGGRELSRAARAETSVAMIGLLIDAGARADTEALDAALRRGHLEIAKRLLDAGAVPGESSMTLALTYGSRSAEGQEIAASLIAAEGPAPRWSAIEAAIDRGLPIALQALVDRYAIEFDAASQCQALGLVRVHEERQTAGLADYLEVLELILRTGGRDCNRLSYYRQSSPAVASLVRELDAQR